MPKIENPTRPLADVNVLPLSDGSHEIVACFMPDPDVIVQEGNCKAVLALDASKSMKQMYGFGAVFGGAPNYVEMVSRKLGGILTNITRTGRVTGLYWAVSPDGSKYEEIGEFDEAGWAATAITGPKREKWGLGTKLLPVIRYIVENVGQGSDFTLGVIITDGIIEDEKDCFAYCLAAGQQMANKQRKPVKLILIGIGEEVDEPQLERFDDMFEGSGIDYDLWSHGMVSSMRDESDIIGILYGELMTEELTVAPSGHIEDESGNVLARYADGVPGKCRFILPRGQRKFVIHAAGNTIEQDVTETL